MTLRTTLPLLLLVVLGAGCSPTRQIETAPPRPAEPADEPAPSTPLRATLTVRLETGETALPDDIEVLRFRIAEIWLKPDDGDWTPYPADQNRFEITGSTRPHKTILSTKIPPVRYDSLALMLNDVYVQFDANAGGPLTMPRGEPLRLPLHTEFPADRTTLLRLTFEPGASLSRDDQYRWYFLPFVLVEVR